MTQNAASASITVSAGQLNSAGWRHLQARPWPTWQSVQLMFQPFSPRTRGSV
jgi:hypothetical protein